MWTHRFPGQASTVMGLCAAALIALPVQAADRSGKEIVETVCFGCHETGKNGAPRIGNAADWAPRASKGLETLSQHAITGVRKMPAHGGQAALSDLEMTRAVAYMVSGGRTPDPDKPYGSVNQGSGEQIVAMACGNCHQEGKFGAPRIGDLEAWRPRLQKGIDGLVASAAHGHKDMPARGGLTHLSDTDVRAAITYMISRINPPAKP